MGWRKPVGTSISMNSIVPQEDIEMSLWSVNVRRWMLALLVTAGVALTAAGVQALPHHTGESSAMPAIACGITPCGDPGGGGGG